MSDACRDAARDQRLRVADAPCPDCKRVEVRPRLAGTSQAVESTGPAFGSSIGFFGGYTGFGLGVGTGGAYSHPETERVIDIGIFAGKELVRSITARSVGARNSVAAVAYEMCHAAFQDFPANVTGKEYDVKPRK